MRIEALSPAGLYLLTPEPISDERGFFGRCFSRDMLAPLGLVVDYPEWSISYNRKRGTLRGLHLQAAPHGETKLVRCIRGAILDVAVDLRAGSASFGRHAAVELSADNRRMLYIPDGFAHGFQTLTDDAEILYHISEPYRAELSRGVRWDDPEIGIAWPETETRIMSARDAGLPSLASFGRDLRTEGAACA